MARKEGPHPTDVYVGQRIRLARKQKGASQEALAQALGLTFQQVQKYERGSNRVSASMLQTCADFFDVEVGFFFPERKPKGNISDKFIQDFAADPDGYRIAEAFTKVPAPARRPIAELVVSLAAQG